MLHLANLDRDRVTSPYYTHAVEAFTAIARSVQGHTFTYAYYYHPSP